MIVSYAEIVSEEICLEGLEGITPETLVARLSVRLGVPFPLRKAWTIALGLDGVSFFELPEPRPKIGTFARFTRNGGQQYELTPGPEPSDADVYPHSPVKGVLGSCLHYRTRRDVTARAPSYTYEDISGRLFDTLVIVGSQEWRWRWIAPGQLPCRSNDIGDIAYCTLERIARSRHNGELSQENDSFKAIQDKAKDRFYIRKLLISMGMIINQGFHSIGKLKTVKMALTLYRFYCECNDEVSQFRQSLEQYFNDSKIKNYAEMKTDLNIDPSQWKKFRKTRYFQKNFKLKQVNCQNSDPGCQEETSFRAIEFITKSSIDKDDEDDEDIASDIHGDSCILRESLLRQAYLCIRNTASKGIGLKRLAKKLGIETLSARGAIRHLMLKGVLYGEVCENNTQKFMRYYSQIYKGQVSAEIELAKSQMKQLFNTDDESSSHKPTETGASNKLEEEVSLKMSNRMNLILEKVSEHHIITQLSVLQQHIALHEKNNCIDTRTLKKLLVNLHEEEKMNFFQRTISVQNLKTLLYFICERSIDMKNPIIESIIRETSDKLLLRHRNLQTPNQVANTRPAKNPCAGKHYGSLPKFSKMRLLHKFLFYILYTHSEKASPRQHLQSHVVQMIQEEGWDEADFVEYDGAPEGYAFVPPAIKLNEGWVRLYDVISSVPLFIFMQLVNVNFHVENIDSYLKHPIKRQLLMKHLPHTMQSALKWSSYVGKFYSVTMNLCSIGLLQFCDNQSKNKGKVFLYINKNAILFDTTLSNPSYYYIDNKQYPLEEYHFNCAKDIEDYWNRANFICTNTPLNRKCASVGEVVEIENPTIKFAQLFKGIPIDEANNKDSGYIPGDHLGAGGYDSCFFSHLKRNWVTDSFEMTRIKMRPPEKKDLMINYPKKIKPNRSQIIKTRAFTRRVVQLPQYTQLKKAKINEIDRSALQLLGMKRSKWSHTETRLVFIAKIAILIMNSNENWVLMEALRDVLHKCLSSYDKSSMACQRRIKYIMKKPHLVRDLNLQLAEMQRHPTLFNKYHRMHSRFCSASDKENKARLFKIHFVELIHLLLMKIHGKRSSGYEIYLPNTLDALHANFYVDSSDSGSSVISTTDAASPSEMKSGVLSSIIHSHLACSLFKDRKYFMLHTYRTYPETIIHSVVADLRALGLISQTKKENVILTRGAKSIPHFKLSFSYVYNLSGWYRYRIYNQAAAYLRDLSKDSSDRGSLNSLDGGTTAALLDLLSVDCVILDLTIPEDIITVDPKYLLDDDDNVIYNEVFNQNPKSLSSIQLIEGRNQEANDTHFVVNTCNLISMLKHEHKGLKSMQVPAAQTLFGDIVKDAVYCSESVQYTHDDMSEGILEFITKKEQNGATASDLMNFIKQSPISKFELKTILNNLCTKNILRRVGNAETRWVSIKYADCWSMEAVKKYPKLSKQDEIDKNECGKRKRDLYFETSSKKICTSAGRKASVIEKAQKVIETVSKKAQNMYISPRPWIKPDGEINFQLLWRWIASILTYLLLYPMTSMCGLQQRFKYIQHHHLRLLIEIISKIGCVRLVHVKKQKVSLWSSSRANEISLEEATGLEDDSELYVETLEAPIIKFILLKESKIEVEVDIK